MITCGIELSGSEARLVLLQGKKGTFDVIDTEPRKIKLNDEADQNEVKAFCDSIYAFFREKQVSVIVIKKRAKKGTYAGGPVGFKLEGIIQLYEGCPVKLIPSQTISATMKKNNISVPSKLRKYQHTAFETAYTNLS